MTTERLPLCWIDLETTGLDHSDPILEVACILTDPVMDQELGSYQQVINPSLWTPDWLMPGEALRWRNWRANMPDVVLQMHAANRLLDAVESTLVDLFTATDTIARMMAEESPGKWRLAGSGVAAFDLHVLRRQMPMVAGMFHYAPLDVGQVRRMLEYALRDDLVPTELTLDGNPGNHDLHRAMADVRLHLAEGRHYRDTLVAGIEPLTTVSHRRAREAMNAITPAS